MTQEPDNGVTFSFVSLVRARQDGLEAFHQRLSAIAERLGEPYEILFVNDGAQDDAERVLRRLADEDPHVRVVELSRPFGHQVALTAGYDHAAGKAVICLDTDGRHPPELIPELVARWREGFEVVCTVRRGGEGASRLGRTVRRLVQRLIKWAGGEDLARHDDFRLLDRACVQAIRAAREQARFVRGMVRWIGFRQTSIPYTPQAIRQREDARDRGQRLAMAATGVFNFSLRPLRLLSAVGAVLILAALLYAIVSLILWPFGAAPGGLSHLGMAVVALFGLQFLMFGLLGEYVGRIFEEAKARPLYVVREIYGSGREEKVAEAPAEERPLAHPAAAAEADGINVYT
jgi:dolichol-phosphate mannosyltransferase